MKKLAIPFAVTALVLSCLAATFVSPPGNSSGGNATNAQPPSIILTNISNTGAYTNAENAGTGHFIFDSVTDYTLKFNTLVGSGISSVGGDGINIVSNANRLTAYLGIANIIDSEILMDDKSSDLLVFYNDSEGNNSTISAQLFIDSFLELARTNGLGFNTNLIANKTDIGSPAGTDQLLVLDVSATELKRVDIASLPSSSSTSNYVALSANYLTASNKFLLKAGAVISQAPINATNTSVINAAQGSYQRIDVVTSTNVTVDLSSDTNAWLYVKAVSDGSSTFTFMGDSIEMPAANQEIIIGFSIANDGSTNALPEIFNLAGLNKSLDQNVAPTNAPTLNNPTVLGNLTLISAAIADSTSNLTNYTADFAFAERFINLTNALHISDVANVASGLSDPLYWTATVKNFSGSSWPVSLNVTMPRSGTNFVNVANGQWALIALKNHGGSNVTNTIGSIQIFDSP